MFNVFMQKWEHVIFLMNRTIYNRYKSIRDTERHRGREYKYKRYVFNKFVRSSTDELHSGV